MNSARWRRRLPAKNSRNPPFPQAPRFTAAENRLYYNKGNRSPGRGGINGTSHLSGKYPGTAPRSGPQRPVETVELVRLSAGGRSQPCRPARRRAERPDRTRPALGALTPEAGNPPFAADRRGTDRRNLSERREPVVLHPGISGFRQKRRSDRPRGCCCRRPNCDRCARISSPALSPTTRICRSISGWTKNCRGTMRLPRSLRCRSASRWRMSTAI